MTDLLKKKSVPKPLTPLEKELARAYLRCIRLQFRYLVVLAEKEWGKNKPTSGGGI